MGEVVQLPGKQKEMGIRGGARRCLTDAMSEVCKPRAVVIVTLGENGTFCLRSAGYDDVSQFDMYARAEAIINRQKMDFLEPGDD